MKTDTHFKYDKFGNVDTDFYVEKAYELRRAYFSSLLGKLVLAIKSLFADRPLQSHVTH